MVVRLEKKQEALSIGRHGSFSFPAGYYVYTGSAMNGLERRIARHLRRGKRMRWHIDYLLENGRVIEVRRYVRRSGTRGGHPSECELNRTVERLPGSRVCANGFGSSDCNCSTHLFYFRENPARSLQSRKS